MKKNKITELRNISERLEIITKDYSTLVGGLIILNKKCCDIYTQLKKC